MRFADGAAEKNDLRFAVAPLILDRKRDLLAGTLLLAADVFDDPPAFDIQPLVVETHLDFRLELIRCSRDATVGLETQKYLRLVIPGVFLYGLLVIVCWTTSWCQLVMPQSWEEVTKLLACVVLGAIYSVTGLREVSNKFFHLDIDQNITAMLVQPFKQQMPTLEKAGWQEIKHVFYHFVDKDPTLQVKSSNVRFNGLLWTSVADLRVASFIGVLILAASMICSGYSNWTALKFDEVRAGIPIFLLALLFLATFPFSFALTKKYKRLGSEQCEYILVHYANDLKGMLTDLAAKHK